MELNVLWIDDLWETQRDIIGEAEQEEINIFPFESSEEGMEALNNRLDFFHAVILDAKVKNKKVDTKTGLDGLRESRDKLIEINKNVYLPYFIFTGQPDYADANWFQESYGNYFVKGRDNDKLYSAIKASIANKPNFVIGKKYNQVFDCCSDKYFGTEVEDVSKKIMTLLKVVEGYENRNTEDLLNPVRKVLELIFFKLNEIGVIPDSVTKEKGWINKSGAFLADEHNEFINRNKAPEVINFLIDSILKVTQDGSHKKGSLNLEVDKYINDSNSNYLFNSVVYQLIEVVGWFKSFVDLNSNKEINKLKFEKRKVETHGIWIEGVIVKVADNGWGTFEANDKSIKASVHPPLMNELQIELDAKVQIITKPGPNDKIHLDKIELIN